MENWQQHSLEEKVNLEDLVLFPSNSYTNEGFREYSEEIKGDSQSQDKIDNSAKSEIKTEKVELHDKESIGKPFEYFTDGNEEICQICGLTFGNKAVLKIHLFIQKGIKMIKIKIVGGKMNLVMKTKKHLSALFVNIKLG